MAVLIEESDSRTLLSIHEDVMSGEINEEDCPWVRVGNLYLSITQTGNKSWPPVVNHLYENGHRKFKVLSGRHGSPAGGFGLDSRIDPTAVDPAHFTEDKAEATSLKATYATRPFDLTVENVGIKDQSTRDRLKVRAKTDLDKGHTVIFAWCHSISSMFLYHTSRTDSAQFTAKSIYNKTVQTVVTDKYDWVKRFINLQY